MIFPPRHLVDVEWRTVRQATEGGRLGPEAKVATRFANPLARGRDVQPIMVYTRDWRDQADVQRVISALRELGITGKAFYKRDEDTREGRYGDGVSIYVSPPGAAWFEIADPSNAPRAAPQSRRTPAQPAHSAGSSPRPVDAALQDGPSRPIREQLPLTLAEAVASAFADPGPLLDSGAHARLYGDAYDPEDGPARMRRRTLPASGAPGVTLAVGAVSRVVNALSGAGADEAAEVFLEVFGDSYGFWPEVQAVGWLRVWPRGTQEPT